MFIVQVREDGPLGITQLEVPIPGSLDVGCAYCDTRLLGDGRVVGWFFDGYSGGIAFCHQHIISDEPGVKVYFFATYDEADTFVKEAP